ncbi:MAG: hypothetical protein BWX84_00202 [Verrucomicrobia bacterium ADurb.Bin118]|nr:MAG: hypothetical protein BWX84_00202 [Verrucomicrobia bacterium ADurb.Bin118]
MRPGQQRIIRADKHTDGFLEGRQNLVLVAGPDLVH